MDMPGTLTSHPQNLGPLISFSEQELRDEKLQHEILKLLISRKPNTLHIRQRHQACIDRRGRGISIAQRYGECRAVLDAVVLDLGVIAERNPSARKRPRKPRLEQVAEKSMLGRQGNQRLKNRSCKERRKWLGGAEERIERDGRFRASKEQECQLDQKDRKAECTSDVTKQNRRARMDGRQEPFQERQLANKKQNAHQEGVEYAAATDSLLHPGIPPVPGRRGLNNVLFPISDDRACGEKPSVISCEPRDLRRGPSKGAVLTKRSMRSITSSSIDRASNGIEYLGSRKRYFMRSMASRKGKEVASQSDEEQRRDDEEMTSLLADRKISSSFESSRVETPKVSKATTSGLPAEVTAGFFSANNGASTRKGERIKEKRWWERVCKSTGVWSLNRLASSKEDRRETMCQAKIYYGCAPGPSSRTAALDDPLHPEHSFCMNCMPSNQKDGSRRVLLPTLGSSDKETLVKKSEATMRNVSIALVPGLSELALPRSVKSKPLLPSRSLPNNLPASLDKFENVALARNGRFHSSLPCTPKYGVVESLTSQLHEVANMGAASSSTVTSDSARKIPHKSNSTLLDEETLYIQCSERLDHVSNVAATNAWAKILKQRKAMSTKTAKAVQIKRVKQQDVNIASVTSKEHLQLKNHATSRGKSLGVSDSGAAIQGLDAMVERTIRPLATPWEAAWHKSLPGDVKMKRFQTPSGYSVAETARYSLSDAVGREEQVGATTANLGHDGTFPVPSSSKEDTIEEESLHVHLPHSQEQETTPRKKSIEVTLSSSRGPSSPVSFSLPFPLPFNQPTPPCLRSLSTSAMVGTKTTNKPHAVAPASLFSACSESSLKSGEELQLTEKPRQQSMLSMDDTRMRKEGIAKVVEISKYKRVKSMEGIMEGAVDTFQERGDSALGMQANEPEDGEI